MNYSAYYDTDVINGEGTRCTLFVSGCSHGCKGCYNESTWNPNSGKQFTEAMLDQIIADLKDTRIKRQGLSLSGGDPLYHRNLPEILLIIRRVKEECPDKDIWLWSGYTLEEIKKNTKGMDWIYRKAIVDLVDVFIDGKFEQDKKDPGLAFRGSSNQLIHRFKL